MKNKLNWITTEADDDKYLYLTIMRDMKSYCAKGYCEIDIALYTFCELPNTLIKRMLMTIKFNVSQPIIIDWGSFSSINRLMRIFITILCEINHANFNARAFLEAIQIFTQNISK